VSTLAEIGQSISRLEGIVSVYQSESNTLKSDIVKLESQAKILDQSSEVLKSVLKTLIYEDTETIRAIVTEGLRAIFDDRDFEFKVDTSIKRGKVNIDFAIFDSLHGLELDVVDSYGGSMANIVSLLLRVICIGKLGLHPILLLDESLTHVSQEYIDNTGKFLKEICTKFGLDILLVTHEHGFLSYSDIPYVGDLVGNELVLKKEKR
jgi:hypothetical protein